MKDCRHSAGLRLREVEASRCDMSNFGNIRGPKTLSTGALLGICVILTSVAVGPVQAFWGDSHSILTRAAVQALPEDVPAFFRDGIETVVHVSFDADIIKNSQLAHVTSAENPEHYLNPERLQGRALPATRYEFIALCRELDVAPERVGLLPYAILEATEILVVALAEYRKFPEVEAIQMKCLIRAGMLAHYAQDLAHPLHVTKDYNGRKMSDGTVVGEGIHESVDSMVERIEMDPSLLATSASVIAYDDLFAAVMGQLEDSFARVNRVYELTHDLDPLTESGQAFATERADRAASFTASLFLTAWRMSEGVRLPGWLRR
ncbi:MAG: hypothetical protein VX733_01260 [Candidatus Latescibacterota bacterium]|nr:hypothetical protein [Candidatus Latescibacterota bacterium]